MSTLHDDKAKAFMFGVMRYMGENIPDDLMDGETLMTMMACLTMFLFSGYCRTTDEMVAMVRCYAEGLGKLPYERMVAQAEQWLRRN